MTVVCAVNLMSGGANSYIRIILQYNINIQFNFITVTIVCAVNLMSGGANSYIRIILAVQYEYTV